jgi:hypothetical protein
MSSTIFDAVFERLEEIRESFHKLPASLVTWSRLEAIPYTPDLQPGLQAQIADPLWMLTRQWQMSEFHGEDAGTPIDVRVSGEQAPLARVLLGAPDANAAARARDFAAQSIPLETLVEREGEARAYDARAAAMSGLQFARTLQAAGLGALVPLYAKEYAVALNSAAAGDDVDPQGAAWRALLKGRSIDGRALAKDLRPLIDATGTLTNLPARPLIPAENRDAVKTAAARWLRWHDDALSERDTTAGAPEAWNPRRQEYALSVSARFSSGPVTLVADEYASGDLDWYSFRVATAPALGDPKVAVPPTPVNLRPVLPSPVRFPGMPADRYWEFEDATVNMGGIDAGPTDLSRMLLAEFALVYGNDWFVVPLPLPSGVLFKTTRFAVRDTFGVETLVTPSQNTDGTPWTMFSLSSPPTASPQIKGVYFLPPALATRLESDPIEEIALFRDEMANMVWAVERRAQGVSGEAYDRYREASQVIARQSLETAESDTITADIVYRLMTSVPENWIPFVAVPARPNQPAGSFDIQLERRTLLRTQLDGTTVPVYPKGVLLRANPSAPVAKDVLRLEEEEVPREGIVVRRTYQYARTPDGRAFLWVGRSKHPGRGEGASGLRYDAIVKRRG